MKKQFKLLFFVAMLVTLVVMTMVMASATGEYQYVAEDGSTATADTLTDAVANAKADSTITVLASVTETATVTIDKNLTIVGTEGATVTFNSSGNFITVAADCECTFNNLAIENLEGTAVTVMIDVQGTAKLTGCNIVNKNTTTTTTGAVRLAAAGAEIELTDCYIEANKPIFINAVGTVNINSGTYKGLDFYTGDGFAVHYAADGTGATVNIYGGTFESANRTFNLLGKKGGSPSTLNIYGGTFESTTTYPVYVTSTTAGANIFIKDGVFTCASATGMFYLTANTTLKIDGGTFNASGYVFNCNRKVNIEVNGGTFVDTHTRATFYVPANGAGSTITVTGGTFEAKNLINTSYACTLNFTNATLKATTLLTVKNADATVTLGDGVKIVVPSGGSLGSITAGTLEIGKVEYYDMVGTAPTVGDDWSNATFYLYPAAATTLEAGEYSYDQALAMVDPDTIAAYRELVAELGVPSTSVKYLPNFVVGEGVTLNIENAAQSLPQDFIVINGGTVNITNSTFKTAPDFASEGKLITLNSGALNISGANTCFDTTPATGTAYLFYVTGGTLTIDCDSSTHTFVDDFANDYRNSNSITDANFIVDKDGAVVFITSAAATVHVKDGVFLSRSIGDDGVVYSEGFIFLVTGSYSAAITTTITIDDGYFYSPCVVRVTTAAEDAEGKLLQGVTVNVKGGTFVGNAALETDQSYSRMFLFASSGGKNVLNITEEVSKVTLYASKWTVSVIYVPAGKSNNGSEFNVLGGTYNFGNNFFMVVRTANNVKLNLKNATLNQIQFDTSVLEGAKDADGGSKEATPYVIYMDSTGGEGVFVTLENVTVTATNAAIFGIARGGSNLTVVSGTFIGDQIVDRNDHHATAPGTLDIQGGTFVQTGKHASVFYHKGATVSGNALVLAPADTVVYYDAVNGDKVFDVYSPVVKYGTDEYKFWTALGTVDGAPVTGHGAGIYLGADGKGENKENCGIRFDSTFTKTEIEGYEWTGRLGHIIAPADYVAAAIAQGGEYAEFTHKGMEKLQETIGKKAYLDVERTSTDNEGETIAFAAAIYNLKNTDRAYAAVPYAVYKNKTTLEEVYFYGAYDAVDNSRSAVQIACYYYQAEDNGYYFEYEVMQQYYPIPTTEEQ